MRGCFFTLGCLGLLLDITVAGLGTVATIDHVWHRPSQQIGAAGLMQRADALAHVLLHCAQVRPAAGDNPHCRAIWAENRNSFRTHVSPSATAPFKTGTAP